MISQPETPTAETSTSVPKDILLFIVAPRSIWLLQSLSVSIHRSSESGIEVSKGNACASRGAEDLYHSGVVNTAGVCFYRIVAIKARRAGGSLLLHRRSQRLGSLLDPPADNPCRSLRIFAAGLMVLAESPNGDLCVATLRIGIWRSVEMTHENSERI